MSAVDTTPRATQAKLIRRVLAEPHPKLALPAIASNHGLQLVDLQAILGRHGYPRRASMEAALSLLEAPDINGVPSAPAAVVDPEIGNLSAIPVDKLHPDPDNPREDLGDIEELADSMREVGLLQPIVARRHAGRLVVVAGHRRLAAAKRLRWTEVPCIVRTEMRPDHVLAAMLIENGHRADLDPMEEARGLARLKIELNCSDHELAKRVGRTQVHVSNRLALISLSAEDQEQVRNGTMKLVEATHKGRTNSGKLRPQGQDKGWHLGPRHDLAERAKARCIRLEHSRGRTVGGMACGECWEEVIRADEREDMQAVSVKLGRCVTCGTEHQATP